MDITETQVEEICKKYNYDYNSFHLLGAGAFNLNYLLETKQGKFVLRIESNPQYQTKKEEFEILKSLNGKFGPKVYFFDNSKKIVPTDYLIEEFIDYGVHPPAKASDEFIETMGKWYRRLHRIKSKIKDKRNVLEDSLKVEYDLYYKNKQVLEKEDQKIVEQLFEKASRIIKLNNNIFSRRKYLSLIQGDPSRANIFYSKNSVKVIDWDFARYHFREWDLAFFVWCYVRDEKRKLAFFRHAGYPTTDFARKQFENVYLILCIALLTWSIDRLRLIKDGKIAQKHTNSVFEDVLDGIRDDFQVIEKALKNPFL